MKIVIANDHAGVELKNELVTWLQGQNYEVTNLGTDTSDSVDYPDFAHRLAETINLGQFPKGILICGSGIGVSISANRHKGVRAALAWMPEIASLSRQHNNANVLCLPARFVSKEEAIAILSAFLSTDFEGGRHERRVEKIEC